MLYNIVCCTIVQYAVQYCMLYNCMLYSIVCCTIVCCTVLYAVQLLISVAGSQEKRTLKCLQDKR